MPELADYLQAGERELFDALGERLRHLEDAAASCRHLMNYYRRQARKRRTAAARATARPQARADEARRAEDL